MTTDQSLTVFDELGRVARAAYWLCACGVLKMATTLPNTGRPDASPPPRCRECEAHHVRPASRRVMVTISHDEWTP